MKHKPFYLITLVLSVILCLSPAVLTAHAAEIPPFVILSEYSKTMDIHDTFSLIVFTSTGKKPTFKSSDTKTASVNTYGKVTAKKAGTAIITAKIKNAEASCKVKVNKTEVTISQKSVSIERGETLTITASSSNHSPITFKSSKKSVALIDENGQITGIKPGETNITAAADKTIATCKLTVKQPTVKLSKTSHTLYRGETFRIQAKVSSAIAPKWKSNRKSVAIVDENGTITAIKHGSAIITAKVDGVSKFCEILVKSPEIRLEEEEFSMKKGTDYKLNPIVTSGNSPSYSSSNSEVVTVDEVGNLHALKKGAAYITIKEDGAKAKCKIIVVN